jgi:hypothetical protein
VARPVTQTAGSGSVGSVGVAISAALTQDAASGSVGTLAPQIVNAITGLITTGTVGTVTPAAGSPILDRLGNAITCTDTTTLTDR